MATEQGDGYAQMDQIDREEREARQQEEWEQRSQNTEQSSEEMPIIGKVVALIFLILGIVWACTDIL